VLSDVAGTQTVPESLFCSQAAVICLRHALQDDTPLAKVVQSLNSRLTTPSALYTALLPVTQEIELEDSLLVPNFVKHGHT
jgi:hypothetical protein